VASAVGLAPAETEAEPPAVTRAWQGLLRLLPPAVVMSKRPAKAQAKTDAAPALTIPERILLFCVASDTDWEHAGITGATVTTMVIRGLIGRDAGNRLALTDQGRAALDALLAKGS
jgi:hypothetical protein